jgi:hypothetical protein
VNTLGWSPSSFSAEGIDPIPYADCAHVQKAAERFLNVRFEDLADAP